MQTLSRRPLAPSIVRPSPESRTAQPADLDAVCSRLAQSRVLHQPFPHLVLDDFFPISLFSELLAEYPNSQRFEGAHESSRARRNLTYKDDGFLRLTKESAAWGACYEILRSSEFIAGLLQLFSDELPRWGGQIEDNDVVASKFDIAWAGEGYTRSCHLDRRNHAIAALLYFNDRNDFGGQGGSLQLFSTDAKPPFDKFPDPRDVALASTIEPQPNRLVAFLNCSHAYHGIEALRGSTGQRKFLYLSVDNHSRDNMWPEVVVKSPIRRESFLAE